MTFGMALTVGPWLGTFVRGRFGNTVLWSAVFAVGVVATLLVSLLKEPAGKAR